MSISYLVYSIFNVLSWILLVFCLLSWIPSIEWHKQPFKFIKIISDTIFAPFRMIIPPIGGLDIAPIFAFLFLQIVANILIRALVQFGL